MEMTDDKSGTFGDGAEKVVRHARAIGDEVSGLAEAVTGLASAVKGRIDLGERMRAEPLKTLIVAAGVGYVVGGGIFTPATAVMLRVASRLWLLPILKNQLIARQEYH